MRSKFRPGHNLVVDDESGLTTWSDLVVKIFDGQIVRLEYADARHPQTLVPHIPRTENAAVLNAAALTTAFVCASSFGTVVAGSTVTAKVGAATHLFTQI